MRFSEEGKTKLRSCRTKVEQDVCFHGEAPEDAKDAELPQGFIWADKKRKADDEVEPPSKKTCGGSGTSVGTGSPT